MKIKVKITDMSYCYELQFKKFILHFSNNVSLLFPFKRVPDSYTTPKQIRKLFKRIKTR